MNAYMRSVQDQASEQFNKEWEGDSKSLSLNNVLWSTDGFWKEGSGFFKGIAPRVPATHQ